MFFLMSVFPFLHMILVNRGFGGMKGDEVYGSAAVSDVDLSFFVKT